MTAVLHHHPEWDIYTSPGSLWISQQEARSLRLFLAVLFSGQAVINSIAGNPDTMQTAFLWIAACIVFFGLFLVEILALGMYKCYRYFFVYRPKEKTRIMERSTVTTVVIPYNYNYNSDTAAELSQSRHARSRAPVQPLPHSTQAKLGDLQQAFSRASYT